MRNSLGIIFAFALSIFLLPSCGGGDAGNGSNGNDSIPSAGDPVRGDWIRVYNPSDPDALHPYATFHASSSYVKDHLFQYLVDINPYTLEMVPIIAKDLPQVSEDGMEFTYEIREEAHWDNGDPIDGYDYEFSVKAMMSPLSEAQHIRVYYMFIKDVKVDESNPKRFTVYTDSPFFLSESAVGGFEISSRKYYDAENLLGKFSVSDFYERGDELADDPDLVKFSEAFHDEKYKREPEGIYGSGPYTVESWTTGDNITLKRKEDWWGDALGDLGYGFRAYADKIIYKTITNRAAAVRAAAAGEVDVVRDIVPDEFIKIRDEDGPIRQNFNLHTPDTYSMVYLGINTRPPSDRVPYLEDKRVRKALTHLLDVDRVIANIYSGFGTRIISPVSIHNKYEYDPTLKPIPFDPEAAKALLDEAGWVDSNGNGVRDKVIKGKRVEFEIDFYVSNSSSTAPRIANMLAREAEKAGLTIKVQQLEFGVMTSRLKEHQFDIYGAGFISNPLPTDMKQLWHTESWVNGGSNYFGFGTPHTDSLIDDIRITFDPEARRPIYSELQHIIQDEAPVIFIYSPKERIIIHKRFENADANVVRPGYKVNEFWVPKEKQMYPEAN